jgi:hypothetical protein
VRNTKIGRSTEKYRKSNDKTGEKEGMAEPVDLF